MKKWPILFETYNPIDVSFIKSLLDAESLLYVVENENFANIRPLSGVPMIIRVKEDDLEKGREILMDFEGGPFGQRRV